MTGSAALIVAIVAIAVFCWIQWFLLVMATVTPTNAMLRTLLSVARRLETRGTRALRIQYEEAAARAHEASERVAASYLRLQASELALEELTRLMEEHRDLALRFSWCTVKPSWGKRLARQPEKSN